MLYNHKIKLYPDGTIQHYVYFRPLERDNPQPSFPSRPMDGLDLRRKEIDHQKRARCEVFDLCRCNEFDYFVSLTLDPKKVDSYNYDECCKEVNRFRKWLQNRGIQYVIVPEQHESGRFHFHGLVKGDLPLSQAYYPDGNPIKDIYHIDVYDSGFNTASKIRDHKRVASYIVKYLTKDMNVPKGRKRYWSTQGLERPLVAFSYREIDELLDIASKADYTKTFQSDYLKGRIYEIHAKF